MPAYFKTDDIVLAATLKSNGIILITIEKRGNKGTFIFDNVPAMLVTNYDLGKTTVEPIAFNANIKALTTAVRRM
jgi:hypothetical protein